MPIISIPSGTGNSFAFPYPASGKAKIFLEANLPVDVFVTSPENVGKINSIEAGRAVEAFALQAQTKLDNVFVDIPEKWKSCGWVLLIANANKDQHAAVYFMIYDG